VKTAELEWTVLTWNIQGTKHTDLGRLSNVIQAEAPDVVVLQEARRPQADDLAKMLSMTSVWTEKHHPLRPLFPSRAEGAALLTPHTLRSPGSVEISANAAQRSYKRRILQWATIQRPDSSAYRVYNVHFSPHDLSVERRAEAKKVADIVRSHGDAPPAIIAGDFNDHGEPGIIAGLPGIEHIPSPKTNPSDVPEAALDHVLLPVEASSVSVSVPAGGPDWAQLSDHLPVTVRFTLGWVQGGFAS
jgi:endonuclease/exonuclease/phosphatase family metal-dependent hydrolase